MPWETEADLDQMSPAWENGRVEGEKGYMPGPCVREKSGG